MSKVDIFLVCILLLGIWAGYKWGIVSMIFTAISLVAGVWFITVYSSEIHGVDRLLEEHGNSLYVGACLLILVLALLIGRLASWFVEKALKLVLLNWVNKGIGAFVGLAAAAIFLSFMAYAGRRIPQKSPFISDNQARESRLLNYFEMAGKRLPGIKQIDAYKDIILPPPQSPEE